MGSVTDTKGHQVVVPRPAPSPQPIILPGVAVPQRVRYRRPGPSPIGIAAILIGILIMMGGFAAGGNLVVVAIGVVVALAGGTTRATERQKVCEHCSFAIPWDARACGHCTREVI
jgi:hypothetical protein